MNIYRRAVFVVSNSVLKSQFELDVAETMKSDNIAVMSPEEIRQGTIKSTDLVICDEGDFLFTE